MNKNMNMNKKEQESNISFEPHQDNAYAGLNPSSSCLTAWIALSNPVGVQEGCLQFHPKIHKLKQIPHHTRKNDNKIGDIKEKKCNKLLNVNWIAMR